MRIGVLCSGGDAPGMNPCLRAIVRAGVKFGDEIVGICHGYRGLLEEEGRRDPRGDHEAGLLGAMPGDRRRSRGTACLGHVGIDV